MNSSFVYTARRGVHIIQNKGLQKFFRQLYAHIYEQANKRLLDEYIEKNYNHIIIDSQELKKYCHSDKFLLLDEDLDKLSNRFEKVRDLLPPHADEGAISPNKEEQVYFKQPFVAEVEDVILTGPRTIALTKNGKIIADVNHHDSVRPWFSGHGLTKPVREAILDSPSRFGMILFVGRDSITSSADITVHRASVLHTTNSTNYYHWLLNILKLRGIEYYEQQTGKDVLLILPEEVPSYVQEFLDLLGYSDSNYIRLDGETVAVENLVIPSFPEWTPQAIQWFQQRVKTSIKFDESDSCWIYISRQQASQRKVCNFEKVRGLLERYNIEICEFETMSIEEQIKLVARSKGIIGPHGAGLTNMIWADNFHVIELFNEYVRGHYYILASVLGHEYSWIKGKSQGLMTKPQNNDIVVNINKLESKLETILGGEDRM